MHMLLVTGSTPEVQLYNEQGPGDASLPGAFLDAAQIAIDLARGRIFVASVELTGMYPMGAHPTGTHPTGVHPTGVHLMRVYLKVFART
jgi:hypothetical protein